MNNAYKIKHPDDGAVDRFAVALKAKMAESRAKGRNGWDNEALCPNGRLPQMLREHVAKGDPSDVGVLAMMCWARGESTYQQPEGAAVPAKVASVDVPDDPFVAALGEWAAFKIAGHASMSEAIFAWHNAKLAEARLEVEAHLMQSHASLMNAASAKHRIAKAEERAELAEADLAKANALNAVHRDEIKHWKTLAAQVPQAGQSPDWMSLENRYVRTGKHTFEFAKRYGWKDDGEGAFEFAQRMSYAAGRDAAKPAIPQQAGQAVDERASEK